MYKYIERNHIQEFIREKIKINLDTFAVNVCEFNLIATDRIPYNDLKIDHLKYLIWDRKKNMFENFDSCSINLWKFNSSDIAKLKGVTEEQIENDYEELSPINYFKKYFPNRDAVDESLIIVKVSATGKCLPTFYLSNKRFAVTKYRVCSDLFFSR